ncbi:hypothetical protein [Asticcacaulis sp. EMRT-3]|uniref:hypothetical protein n=1 Tax=Asticcacaulis sp. EMRT-3 TaxID=3040349 RepID=UPI0024AFCFFF|nr:hypothetical protein [Asticcacaulis sp. EMRT-3]MDI7774494.1 hypothetical protein [Asticcacaulis sp. EMRT-3]
MALSSVHFEPTTQDFGKLTIRAVRTPVSIHLLIGLAFVLAFLAALSGLYLIDQAVFHSASGVASAQNTAYNGALIDYD